MSCTIYDGLVNNIVKPCIFMDIKQQNENLGTESDHGFDLIFQTNKVRNNTYHLLKRKNEEDFLNTIETVKKAKSDELNSSILERSLSNLSLKSELLAQIGDRLESHEIIIKQSLVLANGAAADRQMLIQQNDKIFLQNEKLINYFYQKETNMIDQSIQRTTAAIGLAIASQEEEEDNEANENQVSEDSVVENGANGNQGSEDSVVENESNTSSSLNKELSGSLLNSKKTPPNLQSFKKKYNSEFSGLIPALSQTLKMPAIKQNHPTLLKKIDRKF